MNLLTMEHITKSYTDRVLLDDVDFGINENEKIGIIGVMVWGNQHFLSWLRELQHATRGRSVWGIR